MVDDDGGGVKGGEIPRFEIKVTHEAKLNEILRKINSIEIYVKDFIKLLKSELLHLYPRTSNPKDVKRKAIIKDLNKFARLLTEEYMVDVQKELDSKEVTIKFDFKSKAFSKLTEYTLNQKEKRAFAGFALLFLRWVLQLKEMCFSVIHGLGNDDDDDETFMYVLSILQDRVLVEESLVPLARMCRVSWHTCVLVLSADLLLLEVLKLLDSFIGALNHSSYSSNQ
ncbi:hypothetical protein CFP56_040668 [Quercus suber]|uniref:Uncharacterized protein n=1 Tax=Quercus suber TaxID=58331 RepID=A0AAW0IXJ5_QUESU